MALTDSQLAAQRALIALKKLAGKSQTNQAWSVGQDIKSGGVTSAYSTIFGNNIPAIPYIDDSSTKLFDSEQATNTNQALLHTKFSVDITGTVMFVRLPLVKLDDTIQGSNQYSGYVAVLPDTDDSDGAGDTGKDFDTLAAAGTNYSLVSSKIGTAPYVDNTEVATTLGKLQFVPPSYGTPDPTTGYNPYQVQLFSGKNYDEVQDAGSGGTWVNAASQMSWFFDYYSGVLFIGDTTHADYDKKLYIEAALYVGDYLSDKDTSAPGSPGEIAKQKLFNAYTFNKTATFLQYSGSSWLNADQPSSYWEVPTSCILGSEQLFVNGLLQDSSSRGIGVGSGEVNDYLIYESGSNWEGVSNSSDKTVIELSYRAKSGTGNPHHDAKVKITYLEKD